MKAIGSTTNSMVRAKKRGLTGLFSWEHTSKATKMVKDSLSGLMEALITVISITTTSMERALIPGPTKGSTPVSGRKTKCTEKECTLGPMAGNTRANTKMISRKAKVVSNGKMDVFTRAAGKAAYKMESVI